MRKQRGQAMLITLATLIAGAGLTTYYQQAKKQSQFSMQIAEGFAEELEQIQAAQLQCYYDFNRWCTDAEMAGRYEGDLISPMDTNYNIVQNADGSLSFEVQALKESVASLAKNMIVDGVAAGTLLSSTIQPPEENEIFSERLQRFQNVNDATKTQLGVDWDFNGNDYNNIDNLQADNLGLDNLAVTTLTSSQINIGTRLELGPNSIEAAGNTLALNAGTVEVNGSLSAMGNIDLNNNNITEVNNLGANNGVINEVNTDELTSENASFDSASITTGIINQVAGETVNYTNGTIDDLTFDTATGGDVDVNSVNATSVVTPDLSASSGSITNVSGDNARAISALFENGDFTTLSVTDISSSSISASNGQHTQASANSTSANAANFSRFNANSIAANSASSTSATASSGSVTGSASANTLSANGFSAYSLSAG